MLQRRARGKEFPHSQALQLLHIFFGDDPSSEERNVRTLGKMAMG
jgi:hypothetical protein